MTPYLKRIRSAFRSGSTIEDVLVRSEKYGSAGYARSVSAMLGKGADCVDAPISRCCA